MQTPEPSVNDIKNILEAITTNLTPEQKAQFEEMFKEEIAGTGAVRATLKKYLA